MHTWFDSSPLAWLVVALYGCGPELEPPADCEGDGPTQLVELSTPPPGTTWGNGVRDERGWLFFDGDEYHGRNIAVECGEPPRVFARDVANVFRLDPRGPWLGYAAQEHGTPSFFVLDPWGGAPPRPIPSRFLGIVDDGLLLGDARGADGVSLWHAKFGEAFELEPVPLDLSINDQRASWAYPTTRYAPVEMLFVDVREDGGRTTVGLDPRTGDRRFVEAKEFVHSKMDGRFVVLREREDGEPDRHVIVDTRDPGRRIDMPAVDWECCGGSLDLVTASRYAGDDIAQTHLVLLPELREVRLEGSWRSFVFGTSTDERRVLTGPGGIFLLEPDDDTPTFLHAGHGWGSFVDDTFWLSDWGGPDPSNPTHEGQALVEIPLDGSSPRVVLEPPVFSSLPLSGGRWALQREFDGPADLRIFDPATGHEEVVLHGIDAHFGYWNWSGRLDLFWREFEERSHDEIVFSRSTSDGATVWRFVP
jgi:hypothetical protein